jgi:hypothetical protein
MRKIITITAATLLLGLAIPAYASKDDDKSCGGQTGKQMSVSEITSKVKGMGYDVRDVELEDGCYEIKAVDQKGARFELELNPVTGEIIKTEDKS